MEWGDACDARHRRRRIRRPIAAAHRRASTTRGRRIHSFVRVTVTVPDPDGDAVAVVGDGRHAGRGDRRESTGNTCPDADGVGSDVVRIRRERSERGDGRVYHVHFAADDGRGGTCNGW
jgi:hypothetical protein